MPRARSTGGAPGPSRPEAPLEDLKSLRPRGAETDLHKRFLRILGLLVALIQLILLETILGLAARALRAGGIRALLEETLRAAVLAAARAILSPRPSSGVGPRARPRGRRGGRSREGRRPSLEDYLAA